MKNEFIKSLINFFTKADEVTLNYNPPTKFHEFYIINEERWGKKITSINDWRSPKYGDPIFNEISSLREINKCLDLLETIFEPRSFSRGDINDKRPFSEEETNEANRKTNSYELTSLFFRFKEKQELGSLISIKSFSDAVADFALSNENISHYKALLIGFDTQEISEANFGMFKIQRINDDEKLELLNNYSDFFSNLIPLNIVQGFDGAWTYDYWITGTVSKVLNGKRSTFFPIYWDKSFSEVVVELTKIIKILRIGSGVDLGIRNFYAKSTFPKEYPVYDKWYYQKFGFGNYAVYGRNETGDSNRQFNLSRNNTFTRSHLDDINDFYKSFETYKTHKIKQVDSAIEYYTNAFDQNFAIYSFTSLMMAFESLLNGKRKKVELNKEERMKLLNEVTENIRKTESIKKIKREWDKLNPIISISKAISIGKNLFSQDSSRQIEFNHFFSPENGCYKLRNDLLHGNFDNEMEDKIVQILPQLSIYVRALILRIIELRINDKLICDETTYYLKLEQLADSN